MTKTANDVTLSDELVASIDKLVAKGKASGSVSEDDIQVALSDVDTDADELSAIYDAIRAQGVDRYVRGRRGGHGTQGPHPRQDPP